MKIALVGLEKSGKTSVFNALTGQKKDINTFGSIDANIAVVKVPDKRIDALRDLYDPDKTRFAEIEFLDIPGSINDTSDAKVLACAREADALCFILRNFQNPMVPHPLDEVNPERDLGEIATGLILADLAVCEPRVESLKKKKNKASFSDTEERELKALLKIEKALNASEPASQAALTDNEKKQIRSFQFLTLKKAFPLVNISENAISGKKNMTSDKNLPGSMEICAKLEAELRELPSEERELFMEELQIEDLSINRFIRKAYALADLISFFTAGEKEVRAWTIKKGSTASQAAGKIHSDMEKGFIRAEVFSYKDLEAHGTEKNIKNKGLLRTEGKDYIVKDGDILNIKFNV